MKSTNIRIVVFRPVACKSLLLTVLEPVIHIDKIDGYQIFTHNLQGKDISDAIHEILVNKNTNIKVKLNSIEQDNIEETSFEKQCAEYFEDNFETLATEAPLVFLPKNLKNSKKLLKQWSTGAEKQINCPAQKD